MFKETSLVKQNETHIYTQIQSHGYVIANAALNVNISIVNVIFIGDFRESQQQNFYKHRNAI